MPDTAALASAFTATNAPDQTAQAQERADEHLHAARAAMAKLEEQPPQTQPTDPSDGWGSFAMAIAALGGALTHAPLTTGLNAMAGVMQATRANDQERAQQMYQRWKLSHDAIGKTVDLELKSYEAALKETDPRRRLSALQADAAAFKNRAILQHLNAGDLTGAESLIRGYKKAAAKGESSGQSFQMSHQTQSSMIDKLNSDDPGTLADGIDMYAAQMDKAQQGKGSTASSRLEVLTTGTRLRSIAQRLRSGDPAQMEAAAAEAKQLTGMGSGVLKAAKPDEAKSSDWKMATDPSNQTQYVYRTNKDGTVEAKTLDGQPYQPKGAAHLGSAPGKSGLSGEALDKAARVYHDTRQLPPGFGGQADREAIQNREAELYPHDTSGPERAASYKANSTALTLITKQKNAAEAYERAALQEFDLAVSKLPKTAEPLNSQILTQWARTGAKQFGDVQVSEFQAALISALDEYAKVLSGSTGSAAGSTDAARQQALSIIPPGATSAQIPAIVSILKQGMEFKIRSYDTQIDLLKKELRGGDESHPDSLPEGTVVTQNGVKYRKSGGQWMPVQ